MVEPRLMTPSTRSVNVQALTDGDAIAFRLMWSDDTLDDRPGPGSFADACAVQLPTQAGPDLPAPQMGEAHKGVVISYWTAAWQAEVDGRELSVETLYPNSQIDHYPFEAPSLEPGSEEQLAMAKRYAPARAADRPTHGEGEPVQDLQAEGPGTLTPETVTLSRGHGVRTATGWDVVIVRTLPAALRGVDRTQVAVAIWEGSRQEAGARKMRSVWIPLALGVTS
jgi:DMSO reductase family type II enzyme heme b subunit